MGLLFCKHRFLEVDMQRYESYKDSGVEWLGEVPSHWEVKRNIGLFDERKEFNPRKSIYPFV